MALQSPNDAKPFYQSKTFWFNIAAAAGVGALQSLGKLPQGVALPSYVLTGANLVLRFLTNSGISIGSR